MFLNECINEVDGGDPLSSLSDQEYERLEVIRKRREEQENAILQNRKL